MELNQQDKSTQLPSKLMILISLLQGLGLLYLHQAIELHYWPHGQPEWLFAFYSVMFIWPIMLLLGLDQNNGRAMVKVTLPFALVSGLLGYYVGHQVTPIEHIRFNVLLFSFVLTMVIATFKALMYSQQWARGERVTYSALFLWSWRNFLTLSLAMLFAGSFWLLLMLWAALFKAINIDFFSDLFEQRWFYYPAIALANGFAIIIFRKLTHIIDTITRLQQALIKFLLVLLSLVSLLFLGALPFTGLEPLWESGGSSLILWMQALILFFVNAVYQDEPDNWPYSVWLHRFIYICIAILPVYSVISFYGLSLRIDQYGWSLSRFWAYLIWFLLALFAIGYLWGIAKYRDRWTHQLSRTNVAIGLVVLVAMLSVNSPLLDFRKMVVADQLQRLADNKVTVEDFDLSYFRNHLARPGYEGLQTLKAQYGEAHPGLLVRINALYANGNNERPSSTRDEFIAAITLLSDNPPETLLTAIYKQETKNHWNLRQTQQYFLQALDLDKDGDQEYLWIEKKPEQTVIKLFFQQDKQWKSSYLGSFRKENNDIDQFYQALLAGEIKVAPSRWNDVIIGDQRFRAGLE
ncbi:MULTISPECIES: DUF4153 domain-containing protein [unclassified Methylophaga]|jgi:hypothetical protein|uniref:DUF4153 domain-containing protein n=2 Tax=Methylophaga TaxID=40222 RepID=UPI000C3666EB|nr:MULTISPECIES: DUF4153 domain-containing protein [unclassified Methylophaga]MBP24495.1 hypothetical protein [Methylophaga sp.]MDX1750865.1 DUF4153 domain-containing protein [Methylophaga sp.]|tara:strand:- start:18667 stop:20397 length:1731 start_codon:yes stop_codon:yes gene_type:complete